MKSFTFNLSFSINIDTMIWTTPCIAVYKESNTIGLGIGILCLYISIEYNL